MAPALSMKVAPLPSPLLASAMTAGFLPAQRYPLTTSGNGSARSERDDVLTFVAPPGLESQQWSPLVASGVTPFPIGVFDEEIQP